MLERLVRDHLSVEQELDRIATAGYSLMLNLKATQPQIYLSTYPVAWRERYDEKRYAMIDPVFRWSSENSGSIRWSDIGPEHSISSSGRVGKEASRYGLRYGAVVSRPNPKCFGYTCAIYAARNDRELLVSEIGYLESTLQSIIEQVGKYGGLSEPEVETLRDLADGLTQAEIAALRGISPVTVKKRLERARGILGSRNAVQTVALAVKRGILSDDLTTNDRPRHERAPS